MNDAVERERRQDGKRNQINQLTRSKGREIESRVALFALLAI